MTDEPVRDESTPPAREPGQTVTMSLKEAIAAGQQMHRAGHLDEAERVYRQILALKPGQLETLHFLGILLHQIGQSEEGEFLIATALKIKPDYVDALSNLGNIFRQTERFQEAEALYRGAIEVKPDFLEAHLNLASLLYECDRFEEAVAESEIVTRLSPEFMAASSFCDGDHQETTDGQGAAESFMRAAERKLFSVRASENMALSFARMGRVDQAVEILERLQAAEPDNPELKHHLAALTGADVPGRAADDYVKTVFDRFASSFDNVLGSLEYSAPLRVIEAVEREVGEAKANLLILDAGCGTGLCAAGIRPFAERLTGVDLSGGMLERARERKLYDELVEAELTEYLGRAPQRFDLIISADTLLYFGDLAEVLSAAAGALRPGGRFVFTLESLAEEQAPSGFQLQANGRYRHSQSYVSRMMDDAGLDLISMSECFLRKEWITSVMGWLVVGRKSLAAEPLRSAP